MKRLTNNPWIICLAAASFFFYQFIQISIFNVLKPDLMSTFNTTSSQLSLLSSLYFYATVFFLIPAGILLDHLSTRNIIMLAMLVSLVGISIFSAANDVTTAAIGRFIIGISGGPFCFLSTMRLASRWFPEEKLAFITGVIVAIAMFGGMVSQAPFIYLVDAFGWRSAMYLNLALGLFIFLIIYFYIYDYPPGKYSEYVKQIKYYKEIGFVRGLKIVMLKPQNWFCGIFASLLNLPIFILGALWGIIYLNQIFHLDRSQASWVCSMLFLGMLVGSPIFGYISDSIHLRKVPMLAGLLLCLISVLVVIESTTFSYSGLLFIFFLIGFGSSAQILAYPMVTESNPLALTGSALSLASVLIMSGGAIFQPLVGWLIEMRWDQSIVEGLPIYSAANYHFALWIIPISIFVAGAMVLLSRETYCRRR